MHHSDRGSQYISIKREFVSGAYTPMHFYGIVTLALVSHFWPLPEPAKSLEMLQRHEATRAEFGGELCQRDNAVKGKAQP